MALHNLNLCNLSNVGRRFAVYYHAHMIPPTQWQGFEASIPFPKPKSMDILDIFLPLFCMTNTFSEAYNDILGGLTRYNKYDVELLRIIDEYLRCYKKSGCVADDDQAKLTLLFTRVRRHRMEIRRRRSLFFHLPDEVINL